MRRAIELPGVGVIEGAMVNVGNPHYVLAVDTDDFGAHGMAWEKLGECISTSSLFPHGSNVEFVRMRTPGEIEFRIYERGCGPTSSSGTGTCASSAAAIALYGAARELRAVAPGGAQRVVWPSNTEQMMLTGPAEIVCIGEAFS
jgi:diaminopimelate epimerase